MDRTVEPAALHETFDRLCAALEDYEAMPNPQEEATRVAAEGDPEEQLDDQILAGFVTP